MTDSFLRLSSPQVEGVLRGSKWLKHQLLLEVEEMKLLFEALGHFSILIVSEPVRKCEGVISKEQFLQSYQCYIQTLKTGDLPDERLFRPFFSSVFSVTKDVLYAMQVGHEKYLIKALKPIVQLQAHHFLFSRVDQQFHPMVLSEQSVSWGIQFSYPQIYQDPKTHAFSKVSDHPDFPNTSLFLKLVKWVRSHTVPMAFEINGKKTYVPMRIGKRCFSWIHRHPHLIMQGLIVEEKK